MPTPCGVRAESTEREKKPYFERQNEAGSISGRGGLGRMASRVLKAVVVSLTGVLCFLRDRIEQSIGSHGTAVWLGFLNDENTK